MLRVGTYSGGSASSNIAEAEPLGMRSQAGAWEREIPKAIALHHNVDNRPNF